MIVKRALEDYGWDECQTVQAALKDLIRVYGAEWTLGDALRLVEIELRLMGATDAQVNDSE